MFLSLFSVKTYLPKVTVLSIGKQENAFEVWKIGHHDQSVRDWRVQYPKDLF